MTEAFRDHLASLPLPPQSNLLVAYSGGPDSTALLHLLHNQNYNLVAAHLHHGQRPEADEELARCQAFTDSLGIPFVSGKADVPRMAADLKIGLEEAGRLARQQFLRSAASQTNCDLIATGHTLDDHVETILLHLARGTGLAGLAGIAAFDPPLLRPILPFRRSETRAYCQSQDLWFHDDPANTDDAFSRARVRKRLVPEFESLNPAFLEAVARMAETVQAEDQFLDAMAAALLEQAEIPLNGDLAFLTKDVELALAIPRLAAAPAPLLRRAIRLATRVLGANLDHPQTLAILEAVQNRQKLAVTPGGGNVVLETSPETLHIRSLQVDEPFRFPLTVPGETESEVFGWTLTAQSWDPLDHQLPPRSLQAVLDPDAIAGNLHFRSAQTGDRIQPLGLPGTRLLSDLLSESKLTSAARRRLPIICDMAGPVWIPGVHIADRAKITPASNKALRISLTPFQPNKGPEGRQGS